MLLARDFSPKALKTLHSSGKASAEGFDLLFEYRISAAVKVNEQRNRVKKF